MFPPPPLVVDSLWVLVLLMFLGGTIVTVRVFLNGARDDADSPAFEALAHAATSPGVPAAAAPTASDASAQAPARAKTRRRVASRSAAPAAWPGGDCPNCGSPTVPSAKFCGECGHRLIVSE